MSLHLKPIHIDADGWQSELPDDSIINIGGTVGPNFTVGGRDLLFGDGSSTSGGPGITLQNAYNNSANMLGEAKIKLQTGRDFVIADDSDDTIFFRIDSETGKITITGDVEIIGGSSIINTIVQDSDHWLISPAQGTTTALKIEPDVGVFPLVDIVNIRTVFGGVPAFRIDSSANAHFSSNINVGGLVDGVDISQLAADFASHLAGAVGFRHPATAVDVAPIASLPPVANVQEALEAINVKIDNVNSLVGVRGYEHTQSSANASWSIPHGGNTLRVVVTIYDGVWEQVWPDSVKAIDADNTLVTFAGPQSGRAVLILF